MSRCARVLPQPSLWNGRVCRPVKHHILRRTEPAVGTRPEVESLPPGPVCALLGRVTVSSFGREAGESLPGRGPEIGPCPRARPRCAGLGEEWQRGVSAPCRALEPGRAGFFWLHKTGCCLSVTRIANPNNQSKTGREIVWKKVTPLVYKSPQLSQ